MVLRAGEWELPFNGILCRAARGNSSDLGTGGRTNRREGRSRPWSTVRKPARLQVLATRLTQSNKREAKGILSDTLEKNAPPKAARICRGCGASVNRASDHCAACGLLISTAKMQEVSAAGRAAAQSPEAQASRAETLRRNASAQKEWKSKGESISEEAYEREILPRLPKLSISSIATALSVSLSYAADIRKGRRKPHPRHWNTCPVDRHFNGHLISSP